MLSLLYNNVNLVILLKSDVALVSARVLEKLKEDPLVVFPSSDSVVITPFELSRIKVA